MHSTLGLALVGTPRRSAFTLLELIVVIIIVGVLAGFAVPRLFRAIQRSHATEALNMAGTVVRAFNRCMAASDFDGGTYTDPNLCDEFQELNLENPNFALPPGNFTYTMAHGAAIFVVTATRSAANGGDGVSSIQVQYDFAIGQTTVVGNGVFSSIN